MGMNAHGGEDWVCGYGTAIESPLGGYVYKVIDDKRPASDGSGYWAIFMICEYKGQLGELCVGHCSRIDVDVGDTVKKGQIIGLEGNHGVVFSGDTQITKKMQDKGDIRGSHRHWQWRPLKKVSKTSPKANYLSAFLAMIYKDKDGFFYEIPNYSNGYHGLSPDISKILADYDLDKKVEEIVPVTSTGTSSTAEISVKIKEAQRSLLQTVLERLNKLLIQLRDSLK